MQSVWLIRINRTVCYYFVTTLSQIAVQLLGLAYFLLILRPTFTLLSLPLCLEYNNGSYYTHTADNSHRRLSETRLRDVQWTAAVVSERVCDISRSPSSAYSELRPVIPVQTLKNKHYIWLNIALHWFMVALCNRETIYIFILFLLSSFFSSPNLSGRRLDVYHTLAHGVALVRI